MKNQPNSKKILPFLFYFVVELIEIFTISYYKTNKKFKKSLLCRVTWLIIRKENDDIKLESIVNWLKKYN